MFRRLARWLLVTAIVVAAVLGISGRWHDPWLWAFVAVASVTALYALLTIGDDLARERFRPSSPGADERALCAIRLIALAYVIVGALDVGHWHITLVPSPLRLIGVVGMAASFALIFRAMAVNRFFSPVVRVQGERGHHVVDRGPYARVRHPGYTGMILGIPFSALVLGSWLGVVLAVGYSVLIFRRVLFEDAYLTANLRGYADYARRVRYKLLPGIW